MTKRIVFFLTDFVTLVIGTGVFVGYALSERDEELSGIGAAMVVLGLLIREWRTSAQKISKTNDRSANEEQSEIKRKAKMFDERNLKTKTLLTIALLSILTFTMWGSHKSKIDSHEHYWKFQNIESKFDNIEGSVISLDERLEKVEEHSHYHRGF